MVDDLEKDKLTFVDSESSPSVPGNLAGVNIVCVLDTGSEVDLASRRLINELRKEFPGLKLQPVDNVTLAGFVGSLTFKVNGRLNISINIQGHIFTVKVLVVEHLKADLLLGMPFLMEHRSVIDMRQRVISLEDDDGYEIQLPLAMSMHKTFPSCSQIKVCDEDDELSRREIIARFESRSDLSSKDKLALVNLIFSYRHLFSNRPKLARIEPIHIELTDNQPVRGKIYPIPYELRAQLREKISQWLEWGVVQERASPYLNPLHCIKKKDNSIRPVIDLRLLNVKVISPRVQVEPISEILHRMSGAKVFTCCDLRDAYYSVPLDEESIPYTAFSFEGRQYCFCRLPMGMTSSCAIFQEVMNKLFDLTTKSYLSVYLDDTLLFSRDMQSHIVHLQSLLSKLSEANFSLNFAKCLFATPSIECLGHVVDGTSIRINPCTNDAIRNFPVPKTKRHLRRYLGIANWRRKHISNFAEKSEPLVALLRKDSKFVFGDKELKAFEVLKESLLSTPALAQPQEHLPFAIFSDASMLSVAGYLAQLENGEVKVIEYASRRIRSSEYSLSIFQLELLAVVFLCKQFSKFILGREVTVYTDNQAVTYLRTVKNLDARTTRMLLKLQRFSLKFCHLKGTENFVADALSRSPPVEASDGSFKEVLINQVSILQFEAFKREECLAAQQTDNYCMKVKQKLLQGNSSYLVHNQLLYCKTKEDNSRWRLIIPVKLTRKLASHLHDEGHFGVAKCLSFCRRLYYWSNMRRTFVQVIRDCILCGKTKAQTRTILKSDVHVTATRPHERLSVDIIGRLPRSKNFIFILSVLDVYSRFLMLYPLRSSTTNAIIKVLERYYFYHFPFCQYLITDLGPQFKASKWKEFCNNKGIRHVTTSPYSPAGNPVEAHHRLASRLVRLYCHSKHDLWSNYLPTVLSLLNNSISLVTQYAPAELFLNYSAIEEYKKKMDWPADLYPLDLLKRHQLVLENIQRSHRKRKQSKEVGDQLCEGNLVFIRSHRHSSSLDKSISKYFLLYHGPFMVKKLLRNCAVLVTLDGKDIGTQNFANLKLFNCTEERKAELLKEATDK